jgi:hypothetical protein
MVVVCGERGRYEAVTRQAERCTAAESVRAGDVPTALSSTGGCMGCCAVTLGDQPQAYLWLYVEEKGTGIAGPGEPDLVPQFVSDAQVSQEPAIRRLSCGAIGRRTTSGTCCEGICQR